MHMAQCSARMRAASARSATEQGEPQQRRLQRQPRALNPKTKRSKSACAPAGCSCGRAGWRDPGRSPQYKAASSLQQRAEGSREAVALNMLAGQTVTRACRV